jgi:hypothetical protein
LRTVRIPAVPKGLLSNLCLLAGLVAICVAIAYLTDWRWGVLAGGVASVLTGVLAANEDEPAQPRALRPAKSA